MIRTLKIFKRLTLIIIGILIITITSLYFWISNRWSTYISENEIKELAQIIDKSPNLSNDYYNIYDKIHPNHRQRSMTGELFDGLKTLIGDNRTKNSPCRSVYYFLKEENNILKSKREWNDEYKSYLFGWGIEEYSSPEKCYDYLISKYIAFMYDSSITILNKKYNFTTNDTIRKSDFSGARKNSLILFNKDFEELNEDEIIELIVRFENPIAYNKKKHSEKFEKKFNDYKRKLIP